MPDNVELAAKYYLHHFEYVVDFVETHYQSLLNAAECAFIARFRALSENARCLFVRLTNRRHRFFRIDKLHYPEIDALADCVSELQAVRLLESIDQRHVAQAGEILSIFTKPELMQLAKSFALPAKQLAKLDKSALLSFIIEKIDFISTIDRLQHDTSIIKVCCEHETEMLKFLFFGSRYKDMDQFIIRDLGHIRYEHFDAEQLTPYFTTRAQAENKLAIYQACEYFIELQKTASPETVFDEFISWIQRVERDLIYERTLDKLILRIGAWLEKNNQPESALSVYALTIKPPARERQVRILYKLKNFSEADRLCEKILADPVNSEERFFAEDFIQRRHRKKVIRSATRALRNAEKIILDKDYHRRVEAGVIDYFMARGYQGVHAENDFWRGLLGLLLWDILFDPAAGAIHNPLQRAPSDFYRADFLDNRRSAIESRLALIDDRTDFLAFIKQTVTEKWGMANPLVHWRRDLLPLLAAGCQRLTAVQIRAVLLEMALNLAGNAHGFPDLLIWNESCYFFAEVKSPNDQLSSQQLHWLQFFGKIDIPIRLIRIEWRNSTDVCQ